MIMQSPLILVFSNMNFLWLSELYWTFCFFSHYLARYLVNCLLVSLPMFDPLFHPLLSKLKNEKVFTSRNAFPPLSLSFALYVVCHQYRISLVSLSNSYFLIVRASGIVRDNNSQMVVVAAAYYCVCSNVCHCRRTHWLA